MTMTATAPTAPARISPYDLLGENVTGITDLDTIAVRGGIDWTVRMEPVSAMHEQATGGPSLVSTSDYRAVVRQDTGDILAVHTDGYVPTQYREILELGLMLTDADPDAAVESVGTMKNGRQFFATINLGDIVVDPAGVNDVSQNKLALFGSHDGSLGVTFATTTIRVFCTNQAPAIRKNAERLIVVKHTKNSAARLAAVAHALDMGRTSAKAYEQDATALQQETMSTDAFLRFVEKLWPTNADAEGAAATKQENRRDSLVSTFKGDGCIGTLGATRWAAFNAVTEYLDHGRGTSGDKRALATVKHAGWVSDTKLRAGSLLLSMN